MLKKYWIIIFFIFFVQKPIYNGIQTSKTESIETKGYIKFKLIDLKDKSIIKKENLFIKTIHSLEFSIPDKKNEIYFEDQLILISDEFVIGYNMYGYKEINDLDGFGLYLKKINEPTFSWEYYRKIGPNLFAKLQGQGKLRIECDMHKGYWIITKMRFIGEHTLRARQKKNIFGGDKWHCIIEDGSYINWFDKKE